MQISIFLEIGRSGDCQIWRLADCKTFISQFLAVCSYILILVPGLESTMTQLLQPAHCSSGTISIVVELREEQFSVK